MALQSVQRFCSWPHSPAHAEEKNQVVICPATSYMEWRSDNIDVSRRSLSSFKQ